MEIIVTRHANERFRERFRLKFPRYVNDWRLTESLIIGQMSTATHMTCWKRSPFHVNRMGWKYGSNTEIYKKSGVYYICRVVDGVCSVLTVHRRVLFYK